MAGRGGRRAGAGRPVGSGKYGEPTKAVRVPESMVPHLQEMIQDFKAERAANLDQMDNIVPFRRPKRDASSAVPLFDAPATAGWTALSQEIASSEEVNLIQHLSHHPDSSFLVKVVGDSMIDAGIDSGDLLLVDGAEREPVHGRIVLAFHNEKVTVKRLHIASDSTITLKAENPDYEHENKVIKPIEEDEWSEASQENSCVIYGTVVSVIRSFQR